MEMRCAKWAQETHTRLLRPCRGGNISFDSNHGFHPWLHSIAPPGLHRHAALGADIACADRIRACRALTASRADAAAHPSGGGDQQPEDRRVEDRVDREAGHIDSPYWVVELSGRSTSCNDRARDSAPERALQRASIAVTLITDCEIVPHPPFWIGFDPV